MDFRRFPRAFSALFALVSPVLFSCSDDPAPAPAPLAAAGAAGQGGLGGASGGGAGAAGQGGDAGAGGAGAGGSAPAAPGPRQPQWVRAFGGTGDDGASALATAPDGRIVVGGAFQDAIDFDDVHLTSEGGQDAFVASLDTQGKVLWAVAFGGSGGDAILDVSVDAQGNTYASGVHHGFIDFHDGQGAVAQGSASDDHGFFLKLDPSGKLLWAKRLATVGSDVGWSVSATSADHVILGGSFGAELDLGGGVVLETITGKRGIVLASFSPEGDPIWARRFDGPGEDQIMEVAEAPDGTLWAQGSYSGDLPLDDVLIPYKAGDGEDLWLGHFDAQGKPLKAWSFQGTGRDVSLDLAVGPDGSVLLPLVSDSAEDLLGPGAGPAIGFFDMGLLLLDPKGEQKWARRLGTKGPDGAFGAAFFPDGNLLVSGAYSKGFSLASQELEAPSFVNNILLKLDPTGAPLWWWTPGPTDLVQVASFNSAHVDASGAVVTAGRFVLKLSGGDAPVSSHGKNDIYVARLAP